MTPYQLQEAQNTHREIETLRQTLTRVEYGVGFGQLRFVGGQNSTMPAADVWVRYPEVLEAYKECLKKNIAELEAKFEKM